MPHGQDAELEDDIHAIIDSIFQSHEGLILNAFNYGIEVSTREWIEGMISAGLKANQVLEIWNQRDMIAGERKNLETHE